MEFSNVEICIHQVRMGEILADKTNCEIFRRGHTYYKNQ